MVTQLKLKLKAENGEKPSPSWGYLLYGILMQRFDKEFAEYLHEQNLKPISQYITRTDSAAATWRINLLDRPSADAVINALSECDEVFSERRETVFKLMEKEISEPVGTLELCNRCFAPEKVGNAVEIRFLTPCSFKSEEEYCLFPSAELIIKSLVNKWNAFADDFVLKDEAAIKELIQRTRISKYELRSAVFHLKGTRIPSFTGKVTLSVYGPDPLVRLFNLIAAFSGYAGIGIKTALGMGGCEASPL